MFLTRCLHPAVLGDGVAIKPEDGVLRAPADAMVAVVMEESLHACGLVLENGMELLLHIGLDTVDMKGDGFRAFVKPGDRVRAGEELIAFDREKDCRGRAQRHGHHGPYQSRKFRSYKLADRTKGKGFGGCGGRID